MFRSSLRFGVAVAAVAFAGTAEARVLYQFDPGPYTYYAGNFNGNALFYYDHNPSFEFEVASTLPALSSPGFLTDITSQILSWRFDGGKSITQVSNMTPGAAMNIQVRTDGTGKILEHIFSVGGALQGSGFAIPGGSFAYYSTYYDQMLVHPGPAYNPRLGFDLRGNPFFCGPPCSEYGSTRVNAGIWQAPQQLGGLGGVPEPASWALMIVGFAGVGSAMRRKTQIRVNYA